MPTIKRKVDMNLGELLCWAFDNEEQARFRDFSSKSMRVRFNDNAKPEIIFAKQFLPIEQTFKVQIEEEITEYTNLDTLVEVRESGIVHTHYDTSIREEERDSTVEFHTLIEGKLVLIWDREEGLVE